MIQIPKTELIQITELKEDGKNPNKMNTNSFNALKEVIKKYGFIVPIITNKDLLIADGFHRFKAAKELNIDSVPVIRLDVTEVDRRILRQVLNKLKGTHSELLDIEEYKFIFEENEIEELIKFIPSYNNEINKLLKNQFEEQKEEDLVLSNYDETKLTTKIKQGDIYLLGTHILMCGDSTKKEDVTKLMNGTKARLLWSDPPWNVNYGQNHPSWKKREQIKNDDLGENFYIFLEKVFNNYKEISEDGCMVYIVMSAQEWGNIMDIMKDKEFHWSSTIIWKKDSLVLSRKDYHTQYEPIWYGWKEGTRLKPLIDRTQSDVWDIQRPKISIEHPTMKPVELITRSINNSSNKDDIVVDLFGGSGSTLIACEQTSRKCRMMELDPVYCQIIINRWEKYTEQKATKVIENV